MNPKQQKPTTPWSLIVIFFILAAIVISGGITYYALHKRRILNDSLKELSTIGDLKVKQITKWRRERIADGAFLAQNVSISRQFLQYLNHQGDERLKSDLIADLISLTENYDYKNALFLDDKFNVHLFYPGRDTVIGDYLKGRLPKVFSDGKVVLTDLHQTGKVSFIHLDLLVPLKVPGDTAVFGILVLRIDPYKVLYPLIKSWPVVSKTAESLLFRREGDDVVYLNELRFRENTEMALRLPVTEDKLPAAMALQGIQEASDAVDYRGVSVIATMKKVPETLWYLVAKVDRKEALYRLRRQTSLTAFSMALLVLTTGFFLGFIWWNQRVRFYRSRYEAEVERLALVKHYDYILKNANDIIFLFDSNYIIVEANDKAMETYRYDRDEFIGHSVRILRTDLTIDKLESDLKELNEVGYSTYETIHKRKDGTIFPIEISARKLEIESTVYYQSISRDITDRKLADETLRESEERFRKLFENSPLGMVMTGKDMGIVRANSAFCKMIGYSEEELHGMTFRNFTHPDNIGADEVGILLLVAKKIPIYHTEKKYIRSNGVVIWGSVTIVLIRNKKDEVQFFFEMVEDITARKSAEAELEKSFSLQKATLESTADGILVVDSNGKIVQYNQKFAEMWRIPDLVLERMEDQAALDFVFNQLKDPQGFIDKVKYLYSAPEAISSDQMEFIDGRVFDRYSQPQKISGKTVGRVWSFRDITERKKAEAEIIKAKEKAEESDRLKTAFLHNVSHEIRTPMNAILGFSTLLSEPGISDEDRKQFTDVIFQSGSQLLSIINDIVDLASIESGQVKVSIKQINLNTMLRRLNEQFSYKEKSYRITLNLQTPVPQKDAEIMTDSTKLVQVISNLINNAFKFTKKGKITFGYDLKGDFIEFYVKDTGIGIAPEHQSRIFERFYQVDSAVSRQYGGTGLGLSICKAYVELMGGEIWLESVRGKGTSFYFKIPYLRGEQKTSPFHSQL
ncbi:MAG: PAS domain S-box protein [Bacteroidales bacterium]|jgi:PAS domain S-box-containing protein|nr:PAS domain S-box protein [Bacteroidales bacterium]